jgi:hypothetical protein
MRIGFFLCWSLVIGYMLAGLSSVALPLNMPIEPENVIISPRQTTIISRSVSLDIQVTASWGQLIVSEASIINWYAPGRAGVYPMSVNARGEKQDLHLLVFEPEQWVSREAFAYILSLFLPAGPAKNVPDLSPGHWSRPALARCLELGVIRRYPDGRLWPFAPIRRIEAAKMLEDFLRVLNRLSDSKVALKEFGDLSERHWGYQAVQNSLEILKPKTAELYRPNDCLTYKEAGAIFRALRLL